MTTFMKKNARRGAGRELFFFLVCKLGFLKPGTGNVSAGVLAAQDRDLHPRRAHVTAQIFTHWRVLADSSTASSTR